jgi:hypothetical protein
MPIALDQWRVADLKSRDCLPNLRAGLAVPGIQTQLKGNLLHDGQAFADAFDPVIARDDLEHVTVFDCYTHCPSSGLTKKGTR